MNSGSYVQKTFGLDNRIVLLTGASGHLVSEISLGLACAGATVLLGDQDISGAEKQASKIRDLGYEASALEVNVRSRESLTAALSVVLERYGDLHCVLNGAGIGALTPFFEISTSEWDQMMGTLLTGTMLSCQVFGSYLVQKEGGSVINISSLGSDPPLSQAYAYSAAKAGVSNLSKNLAREWARFNVRVNILRPGFFPTERNLKLYLGPERTSSILAHTPMKRFGKPSELIGAVLWLFSDAASFVTGAEITVDGGFSAMTI